MQEIISTEKMLQGAGHGDTPVLYSHELRTPEE